MACRAVIHEMQEVLSSDMEAVTLDTGLHLHPEKLRETLQALIAGITLNSETIIFGFGPYSMGMLDRKEFAFRAIWATDSQC
jgi:hypothetical protein